MTNTDTTEFSPTELFDVSEGRIILRNPETERLSAVSEILHHAYANGGGSLLVDGLSGMGKTHFLRNLAIQAERDGHWAVTFVSADRFEIGEPYSFVERFLAAGIAPEWDFEPEAQQQPIAVARECVRLLLQGTERAEGHVVIIDDAHWIDPESVRVLRHMIPRFNRRNVLIACGIRSPHQPASLGEFLANAAAQNPHDHHIEMQPLQQTDIRALAMHRFGVSISHHSATQLSEVTGGSFLGVDSIFQQVTDDEIQQLHTTWDLPIRSAQLENPLLGAYRELSADAQQLTQIVCVAEHPLSPEMLATIADELDVKHAMADAVRGGVIMESDFGRAIVPKHALIAAAVRDTVDPEFARQVHQTLAGMTEGFRSIRHLIKGSNTWCAELQKVAQQYVREASQQLHYNNASEILRLALTLAQDPQDREPLVTELVLINLRAKTGFRCLDLLPELESLPHTMLREFLVVMVRVYLVNEPFPAQRVHDAVFAETSSPDDKLLQGFLMFMMVMMQMRSNDRSRILEVIPVAKQFLARGPSHPEELEDSRLAWMVAPAEYTLLLDCFELVQWQLNGDLSATQAAMGELLDRATELPDIPIKIDCLVPLAGAAMAIGDVILAHDIASRAVELLDRVVGDPWTAATPRIILAHTLVLLGKYRQAAAVLDILDEVSHDTLDLESRLTGAALRASIAAITAQKDPEQYLVHAQRTHDLDWEHYGRDLSIMAQLEVARVAGDHSEIIGHATQPILGDIRNSQRGYATYHAHALISLGELGKARELIAQCRDQQGQQWFEYWGSLAWLEARLAEANNDRLTARQCYTAALQERLFPLPWALTAVDYGAFLLTHDKPDAAETVLREAVATLEKIGATAYLDRATQQLQRAIERHRNSQSDVLDAMTTREREVAELLAAGGSNKDIAQRLVVSESTVRFHVSNILRKLQLRSRREVPRMLEDVLRAAADNPK